MKSERNSPQKFTEDTFREKKKENDIETDRSDVGPPKYAIHSLDRSSDGKGLKKIENIDVS